MWIRPLVLWLANKPVECSTRFYGIISSPCVTCQNVWDVIVHVDVARFLKAPQLIALLEGVGYQQSRYHVYGGDYSNQLNQTNLLVVGLLQRKHGFSFHFLKLWASQMWPYFIPQWQYIHVAFAFLKEEKKIIFCLNEISYWYSHLSTTDKLTIGRTAAASLTINLR